MAFSALINSFDLNNSSNQGQSSEAYEPAKKRRKLHTTIAAAQSDDQSSSEENEPYSDSSIMSLNSYKSHFDVDEVSSPPTDIFTSVHASLGKITVSNSRLLGKPYLKEPDKKPCSDEASSCSTSRISSYIDNYADVVFTSTSSVDRGEFRRLVCSHALKHILTTRRIVLKNNSALAKCNNSKDEFLSRRDQGFTRPKVLFLLPTRNSCYEVVNIITSLSQNYVFENRTRFNEEYGPDNQSNPFSDAKPDDFKSLFHGNSDDMFRIGIKLTRKTVKLFSKFYHSDIILASPLGLKSIIGGGETKNGSEIDFLSSIEISYLDSADAQQMQNWEHIELVSSSLNQMPKEAHDCDFSRVRSWYLNGNAASFRQTIISSGYLFPEINSLLSKYTKNYRGSIKFFENCSGELSSYISQTFTRLQSQNPGLDPDIRFEYFTKVILPHWRNNGTIDKGGLLVFIPSYLDAIRLRNYFDKIGQSFGEIHEYSSPSNIARSRAHFLSRRQSILIYTERAHHFRRYSLKGVVNVFLYSMPGNHIFYRELVEYLRESISAGRTRLEESRIHGIFTPWDALKVERIVGSAGYKKIKQASGDRVDFEFP